MRGKRLLTNSSSCCVEPACSRGRRGGKLLCQSSFRTRCLSLATVQVMSIDAHNKGAGTAAFLLAVACFNFFRVYEA